MKTCLIIALLLFAYGVAPAQSVCPAGHVCVTQTDFNRLMGRLDELVASKDLNIKLLNERGAADAALASSLKVIEGWKELDAINNVIILKQKDVIALYEKVISMYQGVVDKLEKQLNKPKSAWQKFVGILKTVATLLSGIAIGRAGL